VGTQSLNFSLLVAADEGHLLTLPWSATCRTGPSLQDYRLLSGVRVSSAAPLRHAGAMLAPCFVYYHCIRDRSSYRISIQILSQILALGLACICMEAQRVPPCWIWWLGWHGVAVNSPEKNDPLSTTTATSAESVGMRTASPPATSPYALKRSAHLSRYSRYSCATYAGLLPLVFK
jgi:hypothetical protein